MSDRFRGESSLARWSIPVRVGLVYVVFGIAWITLSDAVLLSLAPDLASVRFYGLAKGIGFVCLSAALVMALLEREQRALRRSERRFRGTFENAAVGIVHLGTDGRWLDMNRRFCEMVGYSRDELLQMRFSDIAIPEDRELDATAFRNLVEGRGGPYRIEKRCVRKDGTVFWAAVTRSMQSGCEHGRCCISIVEDISKRKEVERKFHFFRYLIEKSQDPFYVVSPAEDFRFVYVNPAACRHFGRSERELLRMHVLEWDPTFTPESLRDLWERLRVEKSGLFETVHLHASGRRIPVELSTNYFVYDGQELSAGYFRDISQRRAAEEALKESELRFRMLADNIPQLAWMADSQGSIFWYNQRWYDYTGMTFEEMEGSGWQKVHHPDHLQRVVEKVGQYFAAGEPWEDTFPMRRKDGEYRWFLTRAVPIRDEQGHVLRWFGTNTDITEELQTKRALEDANHAKDRFLAVLSHELRTPLTPVIATLSVLEQEQNVPPPVRDELKMIQRNVELEARLIDDLLDLTRVARGKITLDRRPVDLCMVLEHVAEICAADVEAREIHFGIEIAVRPLTVDGDPARLQQVFWNLVKNAIKFTPRSGCIGVRGRQEQGQAVIDVFDSGRGIPPEMLPRIFNAFEQGGGDVTRQFGGLGLGLAICKTMVELHGGTIEAHSEGSGKGATFTVRLPMLPQTAKREIAATDAAPRRPGHEHLNVLLVEDHGDTARILKRVLSAHGHHVQTAGDVASAIRTASEGAFDVVVSDLGLPDGSGLDVVRALRRSGRRIPAIAMSGYGQEDDIRRSRDAGFNEHLVKPIDVHHLEEAIARAVGDRNSWQ